MMSEESICLMRRGEESEEGGGEGCCCSTKPMRLKSRFLGRQAGYLVPGWKLYEVEAERKMVK